MTVEAGPEGVLTDSEHNTLCQVVDMQYYKAFVIVHNFIIS